MDKTFQFYFLKDRCQFSREGKNYQVLSASFLGELHKVQVWLDHVFEIYRQERVNPYGVLLF